MILLLSVKLGWLPVGGIRDISLPRAGGCRLDIAVHLVMLTMALSLIYLAFYMRLMRPACLRVMELISCAPLRARSASGGG